MSTDSPYFNEGLVSERQNTNRQMIPKALALTYAVFQTDSTGSAGNMADIKYNIHDTIVTKNNIFNIHATGDQNSEPKKTAIKFSTLLPNENSKPSVYYTRDIIKASAVKDIATEF